MTTPQNGEETKSEIIENLIRAQRERAVFCLPPGAVLNDLDLAAKSGADRATVGRDFFRRSDQFGCPSVRLAGRDWTTVALLAQWIEERATVQTPNPKKARK